MTTEYAFIITLQYQNPQGYGLSTTSYSAVFKTSPGMTRAAAFADILAEAKRQFGISEGQPANILFFSLEPNRLGGA